MVEIVIFRDPVLLFEILGGGGIYGGGLLLVIWGGNLLISIVLLLVCCIGVFVLTVSLLVTFAFVSVLFEIVIFSILF